MSTPPHDASPDGRTSEDVTDAPRDEPPGVRAVVGGPHDAPPDDGRPDERDDRLDESHAAAALTSPLEDLPPFELPPVDLDDRGPDLAADGPGDGGPKAAATRDDDGGTAHAEPTAGAAGGDDTNDDERPDGPAGDATAAAPRDAAPAPSADEPHDTADAADAGDGAGRSGWAALGRAMRPRATRAQVLTGVLCAVLGFALVTQVRQASGDNLSSLRQDELVRILDETTARGEALEQEAADLRDERDELLSGSDRRQAALEALERSAANQGILTGRLPATGRGVVVTLSDVDRALSPVVLLDVLEELRNAGAEAIELNNVRITASSAFSGDAGSVLLDGQPISSPYLWRVIGDPDAIAPALQIPGGAFAQVRNSGGAASVERSDTVEISSTRDLPEPRYAVVEQPADG